MVRRIEEGAYMEDMPVVSASPPVQQPVRGSLTRRAIGWLVDYVIVMVPGLALVVLAMATIVQGLPAYVGAVGGEFGWGRLVRLIIHSGVEATTLRSTFSAEWIGFMMPLLGALLVVPVLQCAYQLTFLLWRGRTVGMMLVDVRIGMPGSDAPRPARNRVLRRALLTTGLETGLLGVALFAVVLGQFGAGIALWGIAVLAFWLNALPAVGPSRRTIVDRLAGTVVVRTSMYADLAERTAGLARGASITAASVGRKASDIAEAAGRRTSRTAITAGQSLADAAAVAGDLARQGAEAVTGSTQVQQILNSQAAQQAQAIGAVGVDRARQLGDRAAGRVREVSGRARQMWQARREGGQPEIEAPVAEAVPPSGPIGTEPSSD
jgi:hypothetical protein